MYLRYSFGPQIVINLVREAIYLYLKTLIKLKCIYTDGAVRGQGIFPEYIKHTLMSRPLHLLFFLEFSFPQTSPRFAPSLRSGLCSSALYQWGLL